MVRKSFSVLMSVYKNENPEFLEQALRSVVTNTVCPDEIVMVKDGPLTEELEAVLRRFQNQYPILKFVIHEKNTGLGIALRDGLLACSCELVARMDTDDVCMPSRFEKQLRYMEMHPEIALAGTNIKEFSSNIDHPDSQTILPAGHEEILRFAKRRNPFRHMAVMFRKSKVLEAGNYRNFLWFEDYDLWIRMLLHGYQTANIQEFLVYVRADRNMFARRGGWKYLTQDISFQKFLLHIGFIGRLDYMKNIFIRGAVRLMPNPLRIWIYHHFLRV